MELLTKYPYMAFCVGIVPILAAFLWRCRPRQRKLAVLSGLLATPFAFSSSLVVPAYWNPRRIHEFLGTGPEDLIFSFAMGALVWLCASWPWRTGIAVNVQGGHVLKWYMVTGALGLSTVMTGMRVGLDPMAAIVASFALVAAVLIFMSPGSWVLAAVGGTGFTIGYTILARLFLVVAPDFVGQWTLARPWSDLVAGVPIGEIAWAAGYGACWPLAIALLVDAKIPQPASSWGGQRESAPTETT